MAGMFPGNNEPSDGFPPPPFLGNFRNFQQDTGQELVPFDMNRLRQAMSTANNQAQMLAFLEGFEILHRAATTSSDTVKNIRDELFASYKHIYERSETFESTVAGKVNLLESSLAGKFNLLESTLTGKFNMYEQTVCRTQEQGNSLADRILAEEAAVRDTMKGLGNEVLILRKSQTLIMDKLSQLDSTISETLNAVPDEYEEQPPDVRGDEDSPATARQMEELHHRIRKGFRKTHKRLLRWRHNLKTLRKRATFSEKALLKMGKGLTEVRRGVAGMSQKTSEVEGEMTGLKSKLAVSNYVLRQKNKRLKAALHRQLRSRPARGGSRLSDPAAARALRSLGTLKEVLSKSELRLINAMMKARESRAADDLLADLDEEDTDVLTGEEEGEDEDEGKTGSSSSDNSLDSETSTDCQDSDKTIRPSYRRTE